MNFGYALITLVISSTARLRMATRIDEAISSSESLQGKLIRVVRPMS